VIYRNQRIIAGIKKGKNTRIKKRTSNSLRSVPAQRTPEQYKKMSKILDVRIQGRQKRPSECVCVCVKRKVPVHNNNISNENMITEMEDNKIINVKNKVMTICNWCHDKMKQLMSKCVI